MKKLMLSIVPVICLLMTSCVYSLFPIYTSDTLTYEVRLEGIWKSNEMEMIEFTRYRGSSLFNLENAQTGQITLNPSNTEKSDQHLKEDGYHVRIMDNGDTIVYQARLVRIGKELFLDFYPGHEDRIVEGLAYNYFPVHTFMKLAIEEDRLILTNFDLGELMDLFESNKIRLRHERVEGNVIITAQPKEIQKFLLHYSDDDRVFEEPEIFTRIAS